MTRFRTRATCLPIGPLSNTLLVLHSVLYNLRRVSRHCRDTRTLPLNQFTKSFSKNLPNLGPTRIGRLRDVPVNLVEHPVWCPTGRDPRSGTRVEVLDVGSRPILGVVVSPKVYGTWPRRRCMLRKSRVGFSCTFFSFSQ